MVLKDDDLDLAFVAPNEPLSEANKRQIAAVKLEATKAEVLDTIVELGRTSKEFNYAPAVQLARISAVLTRPRTCYLGATTGLGTPIFNDQGRLIGMVMRFVSAEKEAAGEGAGAARGGQAAAVRVVLPAGDIARLVDQAKEAAKRPAPKDE